MEPFFAAECAEAFVFFGIIETTAGNQDEASAVPAAVIDGKLPEFLDTATRMCNVARLVESLEIIENFRADLCKKQKSVSASMIQWNVRTIRRVMVSEMEKQLFLCVPSALKGYYANERPLGDSVYASFPSSRFDLTEAASCLACSRNNAACQHMMLALEVGLRELGHYRRITYSLRGEIDFKNWGLIIGQIDDAVKAIQQWANSQVKEQAHQFYNSSLVELRAFNDGWRRHLMHARGVRMADDETLALWGHVGRFFRNLSIHISEGNYKPVVW